MNVWVSDAIIKAALAECSRLASDAGSYAHSESNVSSNSSLDGFSSSRRAAWVWVESAVLSGSAQDLVGRRGGSRGGRAAAHPHPADDGKVLTIRVADPESEHHGKVIDIARRHLGAFDVVGEANGGRQGILPANAPGSDSDLPSDLTQLTHLHEPAVVDCLHRRYKMSGWKMYTSSGPILVAINPCKNVPGLYDDCAMRMYWRWGERLANGASSMPSSSSCGFAPPEVGEASPPPHVFAVADSAYRGMMRGLDFSRSSLREEKEGVDCGQVANQSVLVSGESGAGKTVTTKYLMQYLATLSKKVDANHATGRSQKSSIEQRVLQSNAILEAFGNARTLRNDNSSRFGKFIELRFSSRGRLVGASIDTYLLEKARIVGHTCGERTYHIFYEVLAKGSLTSGERKGFFIDDAAATDFAITTSYGGKDKSRLLHNGYDDHAKMFEEVRTAMNTIGFSRSEQMEIVQAVCGLLHLSNFTLQGAFLEINDGEECELNQNNSSLEPVLRLLGVSYEALNAAVTTVQFKAVGELVKKNLNASQAIRAVQALIKGAYDSIFSLLVERVNSCIVGPSVDKEVVDEGGAFIGLLDIFGFESFETNSFEQLCINYCNESLQQQFNRFVFKLEQEEYKREGINWDMIDFEDNQDILELIEKKHGGILTKLDEQCKLGMRCTDRTFVSAVYNTHMSTSKRFSASKKQQSQGKFSIHHYAGVVEYDTNGFMEKNKDEIPMEASELFSNSSCIFIQNIALNLSSKMRGTQEESKKNMMKSSISRVSVGGQFTSQLHKLRRRIDETHPHYIRCLKPNDQLQPGRIDLNIVVDQLRCGGILEAIRVSRAGFPHRYTFDHFYSRFGMLTSALIPSVEIKSSHRPRTVGKLNLGESPATPVKRKAPVSKKQRFDPKKGCETLVKVIAQWILAERKKNIVDTEEVAEDSLSPRSFWKKNQSPQKPQRGNTHTIIDSSAAGIQLGATKIFLLQDTFDSIERVRGQILALNATKISSLARMYLARRAYLAILRSYRESMNRRSLRGGSTQPSETKSEDNSAPRLFDAKLEVFSSKSSYERTNSFATSEQVFEWISIGHGRFMKRESYMAAQTFDTDSVSL
ncbi:hypothetical protein ACHAW5_009203 [Stephanodiscus triporus]|uniref:Myosin motor domain-containing protein n=1 Tax=Stephanodiscus triporus TaxID=2934178 RepID=A0ABD3PM97_9STRA